jgi:iron complex transport system substrate-binding protein
MRIVSLEPFITELITHFEHSAELVGVSHGCEHQDLANLVKLTNGTPAKTSANIAQLALEDCLSNFRVDLNQLKILKPDLIFTSLPFERAGKELEQVLSSTLSKFLGTPIKVCSITPVTFEQSLEGIERIASLLNEKQKGIELANRYKAQIMDWADNFYDRMKNKKVTFISSIDPLSLVGCWIADMIKLCSGIPQSQSVNLIDTKIEWSDIVKFRPDVIVVAPRGFELQAALKTFKQLEKLPEWESIPAVKRGEVVFTQGKSLFYTPALALLDSMAVLVSAIAGFESGYITPRDSFYRLRWMEMQRHRY